MKKKKKNHRSHRKKSYIHYEWYILNKNVVYWNNRDTASFPPQLWIITLHDNWILICSHLIFFWIKFIFVNVLIRTGQAKILLGLYLSSTENESSLRKCLYYSWESASVISVYFIYIVYNTDWFNFIWLKDLNWDKHLMFPRLLI